MDHSPPGPSVHGILQRRIMEWVTIPFSRGSSWCRDQTQASCIAGKFFFFFSFFFSFFFLILFYLTLQYCIGFAIYQNESATGIHVFPILNPPPYSLPIPSLWVSQCTSPKHPALCIEPGLATRFIYNIIHISIPFSKIISPSPSPTESKRLLYTCNFSCIFLSGLIYFAIVSH